MSRSFLRLVTQVEPSEITGILESQPYQLSLFDDYLCYKIICFSMAEMNGKYFARSLEFSCPRFVLDLRKFPYFDLLTVHREDIFQIFIKVGAEYYHRPLEFRSEVSTINNWQFRRKVFEIFDNLGFEAKAMEGSVAVLLNNRSEAEELALALRPAGSDSISWRLSIL